MKRIKSLGVAMLSLSFLWGVAFTSAQAGVLDPLLRDAMRQLGEGEKIAVIVQMADEADLQDATAGIPAADRAARGQAVIEALQEVAAATQGGLLAFLQQEQAVGNVERFRPLWISNVVAVTATAEVVRAIAARPEVAVVRQDRVIQLPTPVPGPQESAVNAAEWNIAKVNAPQVWATFNMGEGTVVGVLDTGFDPNHPDFANWRGGTNSWLDAVNGLPNPYDDNGHGSHTTGTAVGGAAGGTDIGMAPKAQFIACKAFNAFGGASSTDILECMQWMLDPDGNPSTADFPTVVNNSWGTAPGCFTDFLPAVNAWVAAEIFPSFSAGNSGPGSTTGGSPAVYTPSFAVGATDINDVIASFSSRGPSSCDGTIFPEVTAPGVNIKSAKPRGGYQNKSGTSMAAPHVTGCVALMRSKSPGISVVGITRRLIRKAVDLGTRGPDNNYGWGRLDCFGAVSITTSASGE